MKFGVVYPQTGFGVEARIAYGDGNPDAWLELVHRWQRHGASHISFNTMGAGLSTTQDQIHAIEQFAQVVGI